MKDAESLVKVYEKQVDDLWEDSNVEEKLIELNGRESWD